MSTPADKAVALLRPLVEGRGCELFGVETLADLTPTISAALDDADPVGGSYTLEVSSPGLERALRTPAHFQKFIGTLVRVKVGPGAAPDNQRRLVGTITAADDQAVSIDDHRIPYTDVERATTVFTWGPAPKPGQPNTTRKAKA